MAYYDNATQRGADWEVVAAQTNEATNSSPPRLHSRFLIWAAIAPFILAVAILLCSGSPSKAATEWWSGGVNGQGFAQCTHTEGVWTELCSDPQQACISWVGGPLDDFYFVTEYNTDGSVFRYRCYVDQQGFVLGATHILVRICEPGNLSNYPCPGVAVTPPKISGPTCKASTAPANSLARVANAPVPVANASVGNPINVATGNKYQVFTDFATAGPNVLAFQRYYNSLDDKGSIFFGQNWRSNYDRSIRASSDGLKAWAERADGKVFPFVKSGGVWVLASGNADVQASLVQGTGWTFTDEDQTVENYDSTGKLTSIVAPNGYTQTLTYTSGRVSSVADSYSRQITFTYGGAASSPVLTSLTDPEGRVYSYAYSYLLRLSKVTYPIPSGVTMPNATPPSVTYLYENSNFFLGLTGITDENGVRFATWAYDSQRRATSSQHAGGAEETTVAYNTNGTQTVTNALGKQTIYHFTTVQGVPKISQVEGVASTNCVASDSTYTYDTNGYVASLTDREGNVTSYTNNSRGLPTSVTEAYGTGLARTTSYTWHSTYPKPTQVVAPNLTVDYTYDSAGNVLTRTETDTTSQTVPYSTNGQTRVSTYTYTATGQVATVDGPRSGSGDTTTFAYDTDGYLQSVTNALSQVTQVLSVDGTGLPLSIEDENGVVSNLTYNARGWLATRTVDPTGANATTSFTYDNVGNITAVKLPNGTSLFYTYDNARRLTQVANDLGETIVYTLDDLGNVTAEQVKSAAGAIKKSQTRTFDELGRLLQNIGAASQTTAMAYNKNDLVTSVTDPMSNVTSQTYDALNRLITVTDAALNDVDLTHSASDDLTGVTDQRTLTTSFVRNGFGEVIRQTSPDTGITDYEYDSAGNLTKVTDARGVVAEFTYDNLNRRTAKTFSAAPGENVAYSYDSTTAGNMGIGRLTQTTDASGSTALVYDGRGNIVKETRTIGSQAYVTEYAYDLADNLTQVKYPSGRLVSYILDAAGRVATVTTQQSGTAPVQFVASNITYMPLGPVATLNFGNGQIATFTYDTDYRLTDLVTTNGATSVQDLAYGHNAADNIASIGDALDTARNQAFDYDELHRLTDATGVYGDIIYAFDAVGNRTAQTVDDGGIVTDTLTYATTSNRLLTVADGTTTRTLTYTANGNVTTDSRGGGFDYLYNADNRMVQVKEGGSTTATYGYNDRGERVTKTIPSGPTTHYHFDRDGGLIAESNGGTGAVQREYILLAGLTLAIVEPGTPTTPTAIVIDNNGTGASSTGTWTTATAGTGFEGSNYAVKDAGTSTDTFSWTPTLTAGGSYQVYAKYPGDANRGSKASYTVHHANGTTALTLDQRKNGGQWQLLGTFPMVPGQSHRVAVSGEPEPLPATEIVVDNSHPGVVTTGTWGASTTVAGYYGSNYQFNASGTGADTFAWPAAVPEAARYKIYARWAGTASTMAPDAKYTVYYAGGNTTITVNQKQNQGQWNYLGSFELDPAAGHKVVLSDNATASLNVSADAIQFIRDAGTTAVEDVIVDNTTSGTSIGGTGTWGVGTSTTTTPGFQDSNFRYNAVGTGADTFTWPAQITGTGTYKVYAKWVDPVSPRIAAPNAKYTVTHAGGTTTVTVDQRFNWGQWNLLGSFSLAPSSGHKVVLNDNATSGNVVADAVRFVRETGVVSTDEVVVDNTTSGTSSAGTWTAATTPLGFQDSNFLTNAAGTGADSFTWPAAIANSGTYQVYARWVATTTAATNAKYTVTHGGGTTTVTVNQKQNGAGWNLLGTFSLAPSSGHQVTLSDDAAAGTNVIADAVKYVRVGDARTVQADAVKFVPNTAEDLLYVHADHLGAPQKASDHTGAVVWDATFRPYGEEDAVTGAAANNKRFPGQYFDIETALHYNYQRHYDPATGRYIQSDPIGLEGGLNTYGYVGGNPVRYVDPMGLFNPAKGASALGNAILAGASGASGLTKITIAAGLSPAAATGVGALPPIMLGVWGSWNLTSAIGAWERSQQQWNEALCEDWSQATWKNFYGLLPFGTKYDDPEEASGPLTYFKGNWAKFFHQFGYI